MAIAEGLLPYKKESRDPFQPARYYYSLPDSSQFENCTALGRYLHVSQVREPNQRQG